MQATDKELAILKIQKNDEKISELKKINKLKAFGLGVFALSVCAPALGITSVEALILSNVFKYALATCAFVGGIGSIVKNMIEKVGLQNETERIMKDCEYLSSQVPKENSIEESNEKGRSL